ncbi:MAG: hypothetical protein CMJ18_07940 [Phycisphaeraceae bacterium]|nr:hypothetical protein [Phycisphaeraceae bacterium]
MHELSIAEALTDQVRRHVPRVARVRSVHVVAGPMRAIEPDAMQWAWTAATQSTELAGAELELELRPWRLECPECHRGFESKEMFTPCPCGCATTRLVDGDELTLQSIEVGDDPLRNG